MITEKYNNILTLIFEVIVKFYNNKINGKKLLIIFFIIIIIHIINSVQINNIKICNDYNLYIIYYIINSYYKSLLIKVNVWMYVCLCKRSTAKFIIFMVLKSSRQS